MKRRDSPFRFSYRSNEMGRPSDSRTLKGVDEMLSLTSIVDVRVNASRAAAAGTGYSTGLILAPGSGTSVTEEQRLRVYASAADMLADSSGDSRLSRSSSPKSRIPML